MEIAQELADNFSGPIMFHYVWWILHEAKKRGIKRLYFLARDGYTLLKVANIFCDHFKIDIECRYLYCSRAALRMPTYFFIGNEALDLLLLWGYNVTLHSVLSRADLDTDARHEIYRECGLADIAEDEPLSKHEFMGYADRLRNSKLLREHVQEKSRAAYETAIGYFRQEGLFDQKIFALVDSGWTGSIQRSFRQLLEFAGFSGKIIGFYFGMNERPKAAADGEYLTWYFNAGTRARDRAYFCNNLFECLLFAPHGMTKGYIREGSEYVPCFISPPSKSAEETIEKQSLAICKYCEGQIGKIDFENIDINLLHSDTYSRIKQYMFTPSVETVEYYGAFLFCDDVTESYHSQLASEQQLSAMGDCFVLKRIFQKITHTTPPNGVSGMFWAYGTIAFIPKMRWWYRRNVFLWEWLKCLAKRRGHLPKQPMHIDDWKKVVDAYETVSFDIFDTLVYRTVPEPTDVFLLMEPLMKKEYGMDDFKSKRVSAERAAREHSDREEITLPDIYREMGVSGEIAESIMAYEKEVELRVIRGDSLMDTLYEYCMERSKRVFIVTDMYQSIDFIQDVLRRAGIQSVGSLYVSSAESKTKSKGTMFRYIIEKEKLDDTKKWIHIGDNAFSDYLIPKRYGIHAALYDNERNIKERGESSLRTFARRIRSYKYK